MDDLAAEKMKKFEHDLNALADYWQVTPPNESQVRRVVRALLRAALRLLGGER